MRRKLLNSKTIGILTVLLVLFVATGLAEAERTDAGGQWKYVLENGGATITGWVEEPSGELSVPHELDGYPVTAIGYGAFFMCVDLDGVSLPDSVTRIGANPFVYCPEAFLSGPSDNPVFSNADGVLFEVQQQMLVFYSGAKQGAYVIPEGTLRIGDSAFNACEGLTSVTIPGSVESIGANAFYDCVNLISVTVPDRLVSIGEYAFAYCENLTGVTLPASVTSIDEGASMSAANSS